VTVFIKDANRGHTASGQQKASGKFLMIFQDPNHKGLRPLLRACVRQVKLSQLGHFMMGEVWFGDYEITLSGTYGSDGLPISLDDIPELFEKFVPLPQELQDAFWEGGGHNSAGAEAPAVLAWALENYEELTKPIRR
jgi:hypothetical protein